MLDDRLCGGKRSRLSRHIKTMNSKNKEFGLLFWLHLLLIVLAYSSPLWLDWKAILGIIVALQIYYLIRGGCDITFLELGNDTNTTFIWYYLQKLFSKLDQRKTKLFVRVIIPIFIITVSVISQTAYNYQPYFKF